MVKGFYILIWITVFKSCYCQLRMGLGNESVLGKKYLVYFVKSPYSEGGDDAWLCAGAIVSTTQILTAAACLVDVNRIYVVAGYKKYVHARDIEKDKCTKTWKKKVVKVSVPKEYTTSPAKVEWMNVDIGVATVQQPYDFNDQSYLIYCSYVPESVQINYDRSIEGENIRAIALGWGGRKAKDDTVEEELQPKLLQEATTNIIEKTFCTKFLSKNGSKELIEKYLLCASGNGFLTAMENSDDTTQDPFLNIETHLNHTTDTIVESDEIRSRSRKSSLLETCQNDHGGPLITWTGVEEVILGVALNGICNPNIDCVGPRIYVSTAAAADIIKCMLETSDDQRETCNDKIDDKRYQVNDIEIQWPENIKTSSSSSISNQTDPSVRRQNDKEEPIQERPTMNLQSVYDPQNPEEDTPQNKQIESQENLERGSEEKTFKSRKENFQEDRELNPFYEPENLSRADRAGEPVYEELKSQPEIQPKRFITQQQAQSQIKPEINSFNRPHPDYQKQPEIDTANQPQMESYYQPPMDTYYNQPARNSHYNQQTDSKNPPETDLFNQPQIPKRKPPVKPNNQSPIDPNNPQIDSFNQPDVEPQNQHQRPINNHEAKLNQPPRQINDHNQQADAFKPFQGGKGPSNHQPPLRNTQVKLQEQASGSIKSAHSSGKSSGQSQYSNKAPQTSYSEIIESFDPKPAESYNPLDILMAQNQDEEITFKKPIVQPFKPPPVGRHKLPNVNTYMPQPFKPSINKPFEQPHLSQQYQPHPPERAPPLRQPIGQASDQPFEPNHLLNALRTQTSDPIMHHPQRESQTFEQMFSQLHAEPEPVAPAPPPHEETFDEVYRNLHDGRMDEPPEQEFQPQMEQPIKQEAEQTEPRMMNEPPGNVEAGANVEVQLRQQAPLDYPEYNK